MNRTIQILRLEIGGRWYAHELGSAICALSDLYDLRFYMELMFEDQRDWEMFCDELIHFPPFRERWRRKLIRHKLTPTPFIPFVSIGFDVTQLRRLRDYLEPDEQLQVRQVQYASPGVSDLAGVGVIVGHLRDFITKLIDRHDSHRQRELNDEKMAIENERMRIENARNFVALGRELGFSPSEIRKLVAHVDEKQEILIKLVNEKKVIGVSLVQEDRSPDEEEN